MKVAYIVPSLASLGPVIVVRNLVDQMVAHGHECVVFYFDEKENAMEFACETRRISFWKRTDFRGFDIIHTHCFRPMVYGACIRGVRKVTTIHSYLFTEYRYSLGRLFGWLLGRFTMDVAAGYNRVVVLSEDAKRHYSKWISEEKIRVCYNGVDIERELSDKVSVMQARDRQRIQEFKGKSELIGCICELVKIKNLDTMISALARLPKEYKLLLVGSGADEADLRRSVRQLGLEERVLFLGFREEAHRLLPLVDVYAMTSRSEGFCLALVEAAMYGRKIVCADVAGMREKFSDEEVTFFQPDDVKGLAESIFYANYQNEKGLKAKAVAEERFSTEKMYEQYRLAYDENQQSCV